MAHVEELERRLRAALRNRAGVTEKNMFGGVCFMLRDHMLCGVGKPGYMFRVGKALHAEALRRGATAMELGGRRMDGFVWVDPVRCDGRALEGWLSLAETYIMTLPAKTAEKMKTNVGNMSARTTARRGIRRGP